MTRLLLDSSAYIAFKKKHPEVIETLPQAEEIWISKVDPSVKTLTHRV